MQIVFFNEILNCFFFYLILDYVRKFGENFASCQAGISSFYTEVIAPKRQISILKIQTSA